MPHPAMPVTAVMIVAILLTACGLGGSPEGGASRSGIPQLVDPTVSCTTYTATISSAIVESRTLASGCYRVTGILSIVRGARLTISPNTIIVFSAGSGFVVDGELDASGKANEAIKFTGEKKEPGFWSSLVFPAISGTSRFDNVILEYGGGGTLNTYTRYANIWVQAGTVAAPPTRSLTITNSHIRNSATNGIYVAANSVLRQFSTNLVHQNASTPGPEYGGVAMDASELHVLGPDNEITDNGSRDIVITGSNMADAPPLGLSTPIPFTWRGHNKPYYVAKSISISRDVNIEAGAKFVFARNTALNIQGDKAVVKMLGRADLPIVFTGETPEPGFWKGVSVEVGHNSLSPGLGTSIDLQNVTIEYGGSGVPSANLTLKNTASSGKTHNSVSISDTILRSSGWSPASGVPEDTAKQGYGLYVDGAVRLGKFNRNTLSGNRRPLRITPDGVAELQADPGAENNFRGNTIDEVILEKRDGEASSSAFKLFGDPGETMFWPTLNVPYHLRTALSAGSPLALAAGTTLRFGPTAYLHSETAGLITALGTATSPITFTSSTGAPDSTWKGLQFFAGGTAAAPHTLDFTVIEYANYSFANGVQTMVQVTGLNPRDPKTYVKISNSTFRNGTSYAIYANSLGIVDQTNNLFENPTLTVFRQP